LTHSVVTYNREKQVIFIGSQGVYW